MEIERTQPERVTDVKVTEVPVSGQTVTGYGGAIPTRHMIKYGGVWRRVYMMQYSNSGTPYIKVKGADVVLDSDTQHRLSTTD